MLVMVTRKTFAKLARDLFKDKSKTLAKLMKLAQDRKEIFEQVAGKHLQENGKIFKAREEICAK